MIFLAVNQTSVCMIKYRKSIGCTHIISPVAFSLAGHIQTREIQNNILFKNKQNEISGCKSVDEVEAIKFEG